MQVQNTYCIVSLYYVQMQLFSNNQIYTKNNMRLSTFTIFSFTGNMEKMLMCTSENYWELSKPVKNLPKFLHN